MNDVIEPVGAGTTLHVVCGLIDAREMVAAAIAETEGRSAIAYALDGAGDLARLRLELDALDEAKAEQERWLAKMIGQRQLAEALRWLATHTNGTNR